MPPTVNLTDYDKIISALFDAKSSENPEAEEIHFTKDEVVATAAKLGIILRNPPDVVYTYRVRRSLPETILEKGHWLIRPCGKGKFCFLKTSRDPFINIQDGLAPVEILNALPEIVEKYAPYDEQALLSAVRYNRLLDIFTGITCFHLQSHLRTTIAGEGQIEVDDLYVGIDKEGNEYILPIEAKSPDERDKLGWVQITNIVKFAEEKFPNLNCIPIAVKPLSRNDIVLVQFEPNRDYERIGITNIKLYKLVREAKDKNGKGMLP